MQRFTVPVLAAGWLGGIYLWDWLTATLGHRLVAVGLLGVLAGLGIAYWRLNTRMAKGGVSKSSTTGRLGSPLVNWLLLLFLAFGAGGLRLEINQWRPPSDPSTWETGFYRVQGHVQGYPITAKAGKTRFRLQLARVWQDSAWRPASGQVLAYTHPAIPLQRGEQLELAGLLNSELELFFPWSAAWRRSQGIRAAFWVEQVHKPKNSPHTLQQTLESCLGEISSGIRRNIRQSFGASGHAPLLESLLLGDRQHLDRSMREQFSALGLSHLLAISGMHLGMLAWIFIYYLPKVSEDQLPRRVTGAMALIVLAVYVLLTGAQPATLRAWWMAALYQVGVWVYRKPDGTAILAFTALLLTAWNPLLAVQPGFQLSFIAVFGLIQVGELFSSTPAWVKQPPVGYLSQPLWVTLTAWASTLPLVLAYFGKASWLFWLANLTLGFVLILVLVFALLWLITSCIPIMGKVLQAAVLELLGWMDALMQWFQGFPEPTFSIELSLPLAGGLTCVLMILLVAWRTHAGPGPTALLNKAS